MIQFPKTLHSIHRWREGRQRYLFDLEKGLVLPIDPLTWEILSLCEDHSTEELFRELTPKYPKAEIQESLRKLTGLFQLGFLSSDSHTEEEFDPVKELSIFVPEGLLLGQRGWDFWTNWHHFCLLRRLAQRLSVSMAFPESMRPEVEEAGQGRQDIKTVYFSPGPDSAVTWAAPKTCHVIFNLSTRSSVGLKYLYTINRPVVSHLSSATGTNTANLLDAYLAALREYDGIIIDSPWLNQGFFSKFPQHIFCIPPGVDWDQIHPIEGQLAKKTLAEAQGNERLLHRPLIGLILGGSPQKATKVGWQLATANPDLEFVRIDSSLADGFFNQPQNLHTFGVRSLQEKEALPMFLSAFDLCVALGKPGTPASLLTEAMAYGTPILGIGPVKGTNPWPEGAIWVEIETPDSALLIERLSREVQELLSNPERLQQQQRIARKAASSLSWEKIVERYVDVFHLLRERQRQSGKSYRSHFRYRFVLKPGQRDLSWSAVQWPQMWTSDPWDALAESLRQCGRTEQEIDAVQRYLLKQQELNSPTDEVVSGLF